MTTTLHRVTQITTCLILTLGFGTACLALARHVPAGAAPAVLSCKSVGQAGGGITLSGKIPGDYEIFDIKIKRGKKESEMKSLSAIEGDLDPAVKTKLEEDGVIAADRVITVVEDFARGVFTMALRRGESYDLRLYALPSTVRSRISPNSTKATFEGILLEGDTGASKPVRMRCTYDHSI